MEEKNIILTMLEKFCFKIKYGIPNTVFTYYVSEPSQMSDVNRIKINLDFDSINLQVQRKIISEKNNYWMFQPTELKILEDYLQNNKNSLVEFKKEIEQFLQTSSETQAEKFKKIEEDKQKRENDFIFSILGDNQIKIDKALEIIRDNKEWPYKSDKVKGLLAIHLNKDEIFDLLNHWETLTVTRSYVEKLYKERLELITSGKLKV